MQTRNRESGGGKGLRGGGAAAAWAGRQAGRQAGRREETRGDLADAGLVRVGSGHAD